MLFPGIKQVLVLALAVPVGCTRDGAHLGDSAWRDSRNTDSGSPPSDSGTQPGVEQVPGVADTAPGGDFEQLFAQDVLPVFELTLSDEAIENLSREPFEYQPGQLTWTASEGQDPFTVEEVGVRLKGRASYQSIGGKPSFKIKIDEYREDADLLGLRRLTLNNMVQDASMVRERLGYLLFAQAGAPAPLCNHARVYVNGSYYGLYANVQTLDDEFVESRYDPAPGNLYDTSNDIYCVDFLPEMEQYFELETNQDEADRSDLHALIAGVNGDLEEFMEDAQAVLDLEEFLLVGALQAVIADWDGYFGGRNNYEVYHELERDRFLLFPWGIDQSFGMRDGRFSELEYDIDGSTSQRENGLVFQRCKELPDCYAVYLDQVRRGVDAWNALELPEELDQILEQISAAAQEDARRPYSHAQMVQALDDLRVFLDGREEIVQQQLAGAQVFR